MSSTATKTNRKEGLYMTHDEAVNEISEVLKRIPPNEIKDATNHLIGIINGMAIANEMRKAKESVPA